MAALGLWPMWHNETLVAISVLALFAALFAVGVMLMAEPGQGPVGASMLLAAVLLIVSWANEWRFGPLPLISQVVGDLWAPTVAWALYRYPHKRLATADRWMFTTALIWFAVTSWLLVFLSRPEWHQFPPHWWPTIYSNLSVYRVAARVVDVGMVILAFLYIFRWIVRVRNARGVERSIKIPTAVAAVVAVGISSALYVGFSLNAPESADNLLLGITMCSMLAVPVAFIVAVIRRYLRRNALTQLLISLGGSPTSKEIAAALRRGLNDPDLFILHWSDDRSSYLDEASNSVDDPRGESDHLVVEVGVFSEGHPTLVIADKALEDDLDLVEAAVIAVRFSIENALLLETAQTRLAELQAASIRIAQASAQERRRIQYDLHDGIQVRLAALGPRLGAVKANTTDQRTAMQIVEIRDALTAALTDLRKLVAGIRPDILSGGLKAAVSNICDPFRTSLDISIDLPDKPLPESVEYTTFLVISEAVANATKHSGAHSLEIRGELADGTLTVSVVDDGIGGAKENNGTGLVSMTDRVVALRGRLYISSPPGRGTEVIMRFPCV
jgi:signal transduction histidine kinase